MLQARSARDQAQYTFRIWALVEMKRLFLIAVVFFRPESSPPHLQTVVMRCFSRQNQVHCGHAPLCLEKGYRRKGLHLLLLSLPQELPSPRRAVSTSISCSLCVLSLCTADPPGGVFTVWESLYFCSTSVSNWRRFQSWCQGRSQAKSACLSVVQLDRNSCAQILQIPYLLHMLYLSWKPKMIQTH